MAGYAKVPTWLFVALAQYPRLTHGEARLAFGLVHEFYALGRFYQGIEISGPDAARLTGMSESGARRCLQCLAMSPTDYLSYGDVMRRGHNILSERYQVRPLPKTYALNLDWHSWGWPDGTDLEEAARAIEWASRPFHVGPEAKLARMLLEHCREQPGAAKLPEEHPRSHAWQRWCSALAGLHERGYDAKDLELVLAYLRGEPAWARKVSGPGAARVLTHFWEGLILRARRAA